MNLQEFAKLKTGDRVRNDMSGSRGEVVDTDSHGVRVRWGVGSEKNSTPTWHYSVQSTAWFHWSVVEPEVSPGLDAAITDELTHPPANIVKED